MHLFHGGQAFSGEACICFTWGRLSLARHAFVSRGAGFLWRGMHLFHVGQAFSGEACTYEFALRWVRCIIISAYYYYYKLNTRRFAD